MANEALDRYDIGDNDQPTTCPKCGARTDIVAENGIMREQEHKCLDCGYTFLMTWEGI